MTTNKAPSSFKTRLVSANTCSRESRYSSMVDSRPNTEETQLLAMMNDLLYRLMDYQGNKEKWYDEEDIEQKTVMKLKEIMTGNVCPF